MKKNIALISLALLAILLRTSVFYLVPPFINTIIINLVGSVIYLYVIDHLSIKEEVKKKLNIVFLGTLTTYSGVFSDLYRLFNQDNLIGLSGYFLIMFFIVPLLTFLILSKMRKERA